MPPDESSPDAHSDARVAHVPVLTRPMPQHDAYLLLAGCGLGGRNHGKLHARKKTEAVSRLHAVLSVTVVADAAILGNSTEPRRQIAPHAPPDQADCQPLWTTGPSAIDCVLFEPRETRLQRGEGPSSSPPCIRLWPCLRLLRDASMRRKPTEVVALTYRSFAWVPEHKEAAALRQVATRVQTSRSSERCLGRLADPGGRAVECWLGVARGPLRGGALPVACRWRVRSRAPRQRRAVLGRAAETARTVAQAHVAKSPNP